MKRVDLIRQLEKHGAQFLREGGNHSVYVNRKSGKVSTVPRPRSQRISCPENLQRPRNTQAVKSPQRV
jgi:predicted RNA binding protein YcfA (HicA-like mRNA interferase family)